MSRSRPASIALFVLTILAGLASRDWDTALPRFITLYAGDTLWASMVFWGLAILWLRASTGRLAAIALAIAVADELSQLYHAEWIDRIRATRPGALVLGQGFLWSDLVCYAAGVALAAAIDWWLFGRRRALVRK